MKQRTKDKIKAGILTFAALYGLVCIIYVVVKAMSYFGAI